jgi:hypothetical protein
MTKSRCISAVVVLVGFIFVACLFAQAKDKKDKKPDIAKTVRTILNWGEGGITTAGAKLELQPGPPIKQNGVVYDIFVPHASGLPTDQSYAIFRWPINQDEPSVSYPEVYIASDGRLCLQPGKCHDDVGPYVQLGFNAASGEPFRTLMVSSDGKSSVAALIIPHPITGTDGSCSLEVIRATPKFEAAIIRGRGFRPNERIPYISNSAGEIVKATVQAEAGGNFNLVMAPFVKGKDQGTDEITFSGADCSPKVAYRWGTIED